MPFHCRVVSCSTVALLRFALLCRCRTRLNLDLPSQNSDRHCCTLAKLRTTKSGHASLLLCGTLLRYAVPSPYDSLLCRSLTRGRSTSLRPCRGREMLHRATLLLYFRFAGWRILGPPPLGFFAYCDLPDAAANRSSIAGRDSAGHNPDMPLPRWTPHFYALRPRR